MSTHAAQKQRRAGRACLSCRARKVKCNVVQRQPCENCERDMAQCVVPRTRRSRKILPELYKSNDNEDGLHTSSQTVYCDANDARALTVAARSSPVEPQTSIATNRPSSHAQEIPDHQTSSGLELPPFITPIDSIRPAYLKFLQEEDAFTLPNVSLQCELLKAFIEFAYGRMPVVDLGALCRAVELGDGSGGQINIMLYQAVLFAGAAHASADVVAENGCASKKALRREIYNRVQLLFDLGIEANSLVEIQVALLLTSKSVHPGDKKGSWHWVNTAISRAFTLGLHTDDDSSDYSGDRSLRRRIWWCCYVRDKIVALGLGQPTRIKNHDFNVNQLSLGDLERGVLKRRRMLLSRLYIGPLSEVSQQQSDELLIEKTKLTIVIEDILREVAGFTTISAEIFDSLDSKLQSWLAKLPESCLQKAIPPSDVELNNMTVSIHLRQHLLHMAFHTAVYTLHRPRCIPQSPRQALRMPASAGEREASTNAVLNSARHITRLAAQLHQRNLDTNLPMTAITVICPAIFMHLLNMKSLVRSRRETAVYSFRVCMRTMERLRALYSCTDTTITYLETVLRNASVTFNDLSWFPSSIYDVFRLNKSDQSDILAVLGSGTPRPAHRRPVSSEVAMGLSGLDSLLSAGAACGGEPDTVAVGDWRVSNLSPPSSNFSLHQFLSPYKTSEEHQNSVQEVESCNLDWDHGFGGTSLFGGTLTPLGLDLDIHSDMNMDLDLDSFLNNPNIYI